MLPLLLALSGVACPQPPGKGSPETDAPQEQDRKGESSEAPDGATKEASVDEESKNERAEEPRSEDGFFMADGSPEPQACTAAADCLGDTIPDVRNPCCQDPTTLRPHARAYRKWVGEWRKDNCAEVKCPPPPSPSLPPDCAFEVDCVDGTCVDACS